MTGLRPTAMGTKRNSEIDRLTTSRGPRIMTIQHGLLSDCHNSRTPLTAPPTATTLSARESPLTLHLANGVVHSAAAAFNRGMQRTREGFLKCRRLRVAGPHGNFCSRVLCIPL